MNTETELFVQIHFNGRLSVEIVGMQQFMRFVAARFAQEFLVPDDEPLSFNLDENQEEETEENQGQVDEEADFNYLMD